MQTEIVEFQAMPRGEMVKVTLSVPLPDTVDRHIAEAAIAMSMAPLCNKFAHLIAASIHMCRADPSVGAQALCMLEKKLSEAGTESLKLAEDRLVSLKENQLSEAFCFVMC